MNKEEIFIKYSNNLSSMEVYALPITSLIEIISKISPEEECPWCIALLMKEVAQKDLGLWKK